MAKGFAAFFLLLAAIGGTSWLVTFGGNQAASSARAGHRAVAASSAEDRTPDRAKQPNVILISVDTLRADHLGCYGYWRPTTPHLDALAKRGVRFANASAQASWTLPSHMSIVTSQYPHVHGVQQDDNALPEGATTLSEVLAANGYRTAAFISWVYVTAKYGFSQGFDEYTELLPPEDEIDSETDAAYRADEVTNRAIGWLDAQGTEPFFLFVHYFDPHISYEPPPPYDRLFDPTYEGSARGTFAWLRQYIKGIHERPNQIGARDLEHVTALYDGEIRYVDEHIGRLLDAVERRVGADECLIVVTSDHGEELFEHGSMEGHQWTLYEETVHVPLIIKLPGGRAAGDVVSAPVELIDIGPTILGCLGVQRPWSFQGRDLAELVGSDGGAGAAEIVFGEIDRFDRKQFVRDARYKLIHTDDIGKNRRGIPVKAGYELFDLQADPRERVNLYETETQVASRLKAELERCMASTPIQEAAPARPARISAEDQRRLRSLGYVGDSDLDEGRGRD